MCPVFTNTATVNSTDSALLCGTTSDQVSETTLILAASEALSVTKTGTPAEVCAGGTVTYVLTVRNTSAAPRTFDLIDTMTVAPSGVILPGDVSIVPAPTSVAAVTNGLEIQWLGLTIPGKIPPNDYFEQTYTITLSTNCETVGTITNDATILFSGSTHSSQLTTLVKAVVDLAILKTKLSPEDPVYVGDTITYSIIVINNGPCDATGVYVDDTLPETAAIVPNPGWVFMGGTTYRFTIGDIPAGAEYGIPLQVIPIAPTNP